MTAIVSSIVHASRRRPLAACFASMFALSAPATAIADTWNVTSCDEGSSGDAMALTGTLRFALTNATSPAVINLTGLTGMAACPSSKISLTTGSLKFNADNVTINGPGSGTLSIDAGGITAGPVYMGNPYGFQRVFSHYGNGILKIQNLGVTKGHSYRGSFAYDAVGGCIFSNGAVQLVGSTVSSCYAKHAAGNAAKGGAIYAKAGVTLTSSTVSGSYALSSGVARGGGIYAGDEITITSLSTVHHNEVTSSAGNALGGGVFGKSDITLSSAGIVNNNTATSTDGKARGGGVYTPFSLGASDTSGVKYNTATSAMGAASGGGAFVGAALYLDHSRLSYNTATSAGSTASGGGAYIGGPFTSKFSTVGENHSNGTGFTIAGGVAVFGNTTIDNSTVSGNTSSGLFGGVDVFSLVSASKTFVMHNSTVSGNTAGNSVGGLYVNSGTTKIYNSTIAYNTDTAGNPGLELSAGFGAMAVTLQSDLLSSNTFGPNSENDLSALSPLSITFNAGPANNFIRATAVTGANGLPGDTKFSFCPMLGQLRDNGGLTKTHALMSRSEAIDNGNAVAVDPDTMLPYVNDQRGSSVDNGTLDYLRVSGPLGGMNPKADIGAHEVQQDDVIFDTGLEGCIALN